MATQTEAVGRGIAGQALAAAALVELIRLGHVDLLAEIEKTALEALHRSIEQADEGAFDKDAALESGRLSIMAQVAAAKVQAGLETALRQ